MSNSHNSNQKHDQPRRPGFYLVINGERYLLTEAQRQAWNRMIDQNRRYARQFGICSQSDFRKCFGDCNLCPYQREGAFVPMDDRDRFADGYAQGKYAPACPAATPEEEIGEAEAWAWLCREAERIVTGGEVLLRLSYEEGLSVREIADLTGIGKSTVADRLGKLLKFIREHREDLL